MITDEFLQFVQSFENKDDVVAVVQSDGSGALYTLNGVDVDTTKQDAIVWWDDNEGLMNLMIARNYGR